jgi:hypothetical protein
MQEYFVLMGNSSTEPFTFAEAMEHEEWKKAMLDEYKLVLESCIWKLVDCLPNVKPIGCKWVYRIKYKADGIINKYKERLVAKGFAEEGTDYEEIFVPIVKLNTIRMVISLVAQNGWKLHQFDFKSAFLSGDLQKDVYMKMA